MSKLELYSTPTLVMLSLEPIDEAKQVEIKYFDDPDYSVWIDKDKAQQIINHLKEQFEL